MTPEIQALLNRALTGLLLQAVNQSLNPNGGKFVFATWQASAKTLVELLDGTATALAAKDSLLGGYQSHGVLQAAVSRLPVGFERLTLVQMREVLGLQHVPADNADAVASENFGTIKQLINGVVPIVKTNDEHAISAIDANNGANLHSHASLGQAAIVQEGGAA